MPFNDKVHSEIFGLYFSDQETRRVAHQTLGDMGAYVSKPDITRYANLPDSMFGVAANEMRVNPEFRDRLYEDNCDEATSEMLDDLEDLLLAEFELEAFYIVRGNEDSAKASLARQNQIAGFIDEYQADEPEQTTWFVDRHKKEIESFTLKQLDQSRFDYSEIETSLLERVAISYAKVSHSAIFHTDQHAAMIVLYLTEDPTRFGTDTHKKYDAAIKYDLKASEQFSEMLRSVYPDVAKRPDYGHGHPDASKGPTKYNN